jgi:Ca2+-transporting ATPase
MEQTTSPETPIERNLRVMGDQLVLISGGICGMVFLMGFLRGYGFLQMLRMGISLAAAAVPEGLPAAATINFALGINKMKRHNVLIRRLQAVETLGALQTVCMDKTGTLTLNRMSVVRLYAGMEYIQVSNGGFSRNGDAVDILNHADLKELARVCVLCNESKVNGGNGDGKVELSGSPTENALIEFAMRAGIDVPSIRGELKLQKVNYRSEKRLYMTTLHKGRGNSRYLAVKGSPREVLDLCRWRMNGGERTPLTEQEKTDIETQNEHMAGDALRVLGVAYAASNGGREAREEDGLTWLGLVGMADPIRGGVKPLITAFHDAGIRTVMITGDQSPTAYAVARELNLGRENPLGILDSVEFSNVDPKLMSALAKKVHVYTRVSPAHKLQIVQALQEAGMTVAMTGDGINDGPALKAADLGIAMGHSGTDVAREVADVVLENDDLEALITAVGEGRATYTNIRKSVHFFLSTNMSEIMVMFASTAAGMGFPLNVMQLLWINIISDIFPGLALSMEEPEPDIMDQPPRDARESLFSKSDFKRMLFESGVISAASLGAYGYGIMRYGIGPAATSVAFQSLTIGQLLHALSCRSERHRLYDDTPLKPNHYLNLAIGGSLAMQALTMLVPGLRRILGLAPMGLLDMGVVAGSALLPLAINEATKNRAGNEK